MTAKKKGRKRAKTGRPTKYQPEFARIAHRHCLLGATDAELAEALGVDERTVNRWKLDFPEFCQSLKKGKADADANVAHSLYRRAMGYSHRAEKIVTVSGGGNQGSHVERVPVVEHYPPDTAAAIIWLKNRQGDKWRDKQTVEHDVTDKLADAMREAEERLAREG